MARFSVVIPCRDYGRYLAECLASVLSQTRPPDEVILVDDGSTDDTAEVAGRFPGVRYVFQPHAGKAAAFERGVGGSTGDVICHLDADDWWTPAKLARIEELLVAYPEAGGVLHRTFEVDGAGRAIGKPPPSPREVRFCSFADTLVSNLSLLPRRRRRTFGTAGTICIRRGALDDLRPIPARVGLVVDAFLLFAAARHGLVCAPDLLAAYRHHGGNSHLTERAVLDRLALSDWFVADAAFIARLSPRERDLLDATRLDGLLKAALTNGGSGADASVARALVRLLLTRGVMPGWKHWALAGAFGGVTMWHQGRKHAR